MSSYWSETWYDRDHGAWSARAVDSYSCEECEKNAATVEVSCWPADSEPGGWSPLCDDCYESLRNQPFHNPPGAPHDEYVSLGAAL